jgi:predicted murein hydrolase (TIGR00659 family)
MTEFLHNSAVWGILLTIVGYGLGTFINRKTKQAWCNPLLLGILFVILVLSIAKIPYDDYKASAAPLQYLLLPATVCLAVPLYENLSRLKGCFAAVLGGILAGVITSLGSILLMAWLLSMSREQAATLIAKSVTTAIGIDVTQTLGGMVPLASAVIILTGITGNLCAVFVCKLFRITDPVARGVGIGTASHAIGTARAFELGELEGAVSSLSVAVAGILTAILAPVAMNLVF